MMPLRHPTAQACEEQQDQNSRLMSQLAQKEEARSQLMLVRQKEAHVTDVLKKEAAQYKEQLAALTKLNERQSEMCGALETQLKTAQEAMAKREEEVGPQKLVVPAEA